MRKEKENPNYHKGKETGYELIDGEYHIAPLYQQQFDFLRNEEEGISQMLTVVTSHAANNLKRLAKQKDEVWKALSADIGLDMNHVWTYHNGIVKEKRNANQVDR